MDLAGQVRAAAVRELPLDEIIGCGPAEWSDAERPLPLHVTATPQRGLEAAPNATVLISAPAVGPVTLVYDAALLSPPAADRWAERLARCSLAPPRTPLGRVPLMGRAEATSVVLSSNATRSPYPAAPPLDTVPALFRRAAKAHPTATALTVVGAAPAETVSYEELNAVSDRLALALHGLGVISADERLVGLLFHRSVAMVVAILGVLKVHVTAM